ncbi:MAG TPA: DNA replication and repair protein RecF [Solirubrobacterales bacterium]|nr:DNA replication and repair protein RecF [Solirubrobacterales bacterium]
MRVASIAADSLRSLNGVDLDLDPRVTAIVGPNGAGKTNLVEAIYFGLTGRSFRTGDKRDLIPFGSSYARCRVVIDDDRGIAHEFMSATSRADGSRFTMDGAAIERAEAAAFRPMVTVFSPDRLELVKGPPAVRRAHLDSYVGARWPSRAESRKKFGRALAQRNALIARIQNGVADRGQLPAWDQQVAETGADLTAVRAEAVAELADLFPEVAAELGLAGESSIEYRPGSSADPDELRAGLQERIENDLRLGRTSWGPHHDEIRLDFNGRQLRRFGSQGQQRLGLLTLLFAERGALLAGGSPAPLMLLDDVMSELDGERRERLVARLSQGGQSVITAAETDLIPKRDDLREIDFTTIAGVEGPEAEPDDA